MKNWKTAATAAALVAAGGLGAAVAPVAYSQDTRVVTPGRVEVFNTTSGGRLGVSVRDVGAADVKSGQPAGVLIEEVADGGAAEKAGVRTGDIVVEFDGERVRSVSQFTRLVRESVIGRQVPMTVLRDGQRQGLTVAPEQGSAFRWLGDDVYDLPDSLRALRAMPRAPAPPAPPRPPAAPRPPGWEFPDLETFIWRGTGTLGVTLSTLQPQLAEYFGTKDGVLVTSVTDDSAAARAGVKAGDVLVGVNGETVTTPAEVRRQVQRLEPGAEFTLDVVRDKKRITLKGKADERRDRRRTFRTVI